ncbi:MAG TPA: hypothetical protein VGH56_00755 [Solirubrobacteraceae bacterium]
MQDRITPKPLIRSPRPRLLVAAALVGVILVAGCGGSSNSPNVANVASTSSSASSTAARSSGTTPSRSGNTTASRSSNTSTTPKHDAAQSLVDWANCMRKHGDPNQPDPTVTVNRTIDIAWNPAIPGGYNGTNKGGQGNSGPGQYCRSYLAAAQAALRGGLPIHRPNATALVKFSECMRASVVPNFPDPTANGQLNIPGGPPTAKAPAFQHASKLCDKKVGIQTFLSGSTPPPGTIELNGGSGLPAAG